MAKKKKATITFHSDEEKYEYAEKLRKAIDCLTREKDKAETYEYLSGLYQSLGDYENSTERYEQCIKKSKEHGELAKKQEADKKVSSVSDEPEKSTGIRRKVILALISAIIIVGITGVIYLKSMPGRYTRADFYEKNENYLKSYKLFKNLGEYKDSSDRYLKSRYEYGLQCKDKEDYEHAKTTFKNLMDYEDSKALLAEVEVQIIKNSEIGDIVLFGKYKWLVVEKEEDKVLLVKSEPINGHPYNSLNENVTWETCSLRTYLNGMFMEQNFSNEMIQRIAETNIVIPKNEHYDTTGGNTTTDKLFLLNADEATKYQNTLSNFKRDWWLINPGNSQNTAQFVSYGIVMDYGYVVTNPNINIRPAMWVSTK